MFDEKEKIADAINILGDFCGVRDLDELTRENLKNKFNLEKVDVAVLFGGSIISGGDIFAAAMKNNLAKKYIIVGGAGHTTETLREKMRGVLKKKFSPEITEAELFNSYLEEKYNLRADFLECESTNCGNNITFLLSLLEKNNLPCENILLIQDATMQRRMAATLQKYFGEKIIINFAAYKVKVIVENDELKFEKIPAGMWNLERYAKLLTGEIFRLQDNSEGYGPKGKNFIAHVEISEKILSAFNFLKKYFEIRAAV